MSRAWSMFQLQHKQTEAARARYRPETSLSPNELWIFFIWHMNTWKKIKSYHYRARIVFERTLHWSTSWETKTQRIRQTASLAFINTCKDRTTCQQLHTQTSLGRDVGLVCLISLPRVGRKWRFPADSFITHSHIGANFLISVCWQWFHTESDAHSLCFN